MKTIELNTKGKEFIVLRTKQVRQTFIFFPLFLLVSVVVGFIKLGFSETSLIFVLLTFPVFFIGFYSAAIKPRRLIRNIVRKIQFEGSNIVIYSEDGMFSSTKIIRKRNLHVFNVIFLEYYSEKFGTEEYYIIPEFFDDFKDLEINLALFSN